jgi:hypothetical protein
MAKKKDESIDDENLEVEPGDFEEKASELDFDPWGTEEDDGSQRRRDPFRRPGGAGVDEDVP